MEYLDIFDEFNEFTGETLERIKVHNLNLWHRHASCWIMNSNGQIIMEKRAKYKKKNPGRWAKIGGHVNSTEEPINAIIREAKEEIGIDLSKGKLEFIDIFKSPYSNEKYFTYNYVCVIDFDIAECILQEEEVESVGCFEIEELMNYKKNKDVNFVFYNWDDEEFIEQMTMLKEYRTKEVV